MKRIDLANATASVVAQHLFETEAAIDLAMTQIAGFAHVLPAAGREAGFAATRGQRIYEGLAEAMLAQSQARAKVVEVHGLLSDLKQDSFMRSVAIGGGSKDTEPGNPLPTRGLLAPSTPT